MGSHQQHNSRTVNQAREATKTAQKLTLAWVPPSEANREKKKRVKIVLILKNFFSQNYVYEEPWRRSMRLIQGVFLLYTSGYHLVQKTKC